MVERRLREVGSSGSGGSPYEMVRRKKVDEAGVVAISHRFAQLHFQNNTSREVEELMRILSIDRDSALSELRPEERLQVERQVIHWEEDCKSRLQEQGNEIVDATVSGVGERVSEQKGKEE